MFGKVVVEGTLTCQRSAKTLMAESFDILYNF